jgi:hypothetical protein
VLTLFDEKKMVSVKLFLKERNSDTLVTHKSLIPKTNSINEKIFWILKELISGPIGNNYERMFDPNIEVKEIIIKRNTAYISFDWTFINSLYDNPSLVIHSIVNSVLINIRELKEIKILIEGIEPVSTFCDISLESTFRWI